MATDQLIDVDDLFAGSDGVPLDRPRTRLDARDLPPPKPLRETLERLEELDDAVLVQVNDRRPQHLYPRLDERGYAYESVERDGIAVTAIWEP